MSDKRKVVELMIQIGGVWLSRFLILILGLRLLILALELQLRVLNLQSIYFKLD